MYALVDDGTIHHPYRVPNVLRTPDRDYDLRAMTDEVLNPHGIFEVVDTPRPADTATTTHDRSLELVNGVPTIVWTERPKTQAELDADAEQAARQERDAILSGAIGTLRQWSDEAAGTTVTNGNNVQVTQVVTTRLGVFFDRFADLLENQYGS